MKVNGYISIIYIIYTLIHYTHVIKYTYTSIVSYLINRIIYYVSYGKITPKNTYDRLIS